MNRLADETSPYLLQHADNPVDWYPWGDEAIERARKEDKPIFLSIGYSACHWCHVMERESFAVPATAKLMNKHFVNVKVDREERPDIDSLYMDAAVALTHSSGWPLNVFMTPDGKPFWAATYLPPVPRNGLRSFPDVLKRVAEVWKTSREQLEKTGDSLTEHMQKAVEQAPPEAEVTPKILTVAVEGLTMGFDWKWGGWGRAPKFPAPPVLEFLLRHGSPRVLIEKTLDSMAAGGMYDLVGGGFHRYAVDERWLVPHFEKMLVDNAQLASTYLHGWLVLGEPRYREVAEQTLDYLMGEMRLPDGGFASSQDADTDGEEGLTYTWSRSDAPDEKLHVFEKGRFILRGEIDDELRTRLREIRAGRPQPARDDKAVAYANGLMLATLAESARFLDRPDLLAAARRLAEFVLGPLSSSEGRLHRTWREGRATGFGYLEDYADVAHGLIELHAASGEARWLEEARRLTLLAVELFADDEHGGFFHTPSDAPALVVRKKIYDDSGSPSGNSMLAYDLFRLARIYGDDSLEQHGDSIYPVLTLALTKAPSSFGWALAALDFRMAPRKEIAIVGPPDAPVARAVLERFDPHAVIAFGPSETIPLLEGRTLVDGEPAVYVCERFACQAPVTDPAELAGAGAAGRR